MWRDRGIARRLISVRDNEVAAGAAGIPVVRTKLMAFALSGFMAGYAGVCLAFATERFSTDTFDPSISILVVSMVVIGGLDAIPGAVLGALYLVGLPAIFGSSTTIQFLTSGVGLMAFILYLPGGMAQVMHQLGDLATAGVANLQARRRGEPPPGSAPGAPAAPGAPDAPPRVRWPRSTRVSRRGARGDDTGADLERRHHRACVPSPTTMTTTGGHLARGRERQGPPTSPSATSWCRSAACSPSTR